MFYCNKSYKKHWKIAPRHVGQELSYQCTSCSKQFRTLSHHLRHVKNPSKCIKTGLASAPGLLLNLNSQQPIATEEEESNTLLQSNDVMLMQKYKQDDDEVPLLDTSRSSTDLMLQWTQRYEEEVKESNLIIARSPIGSNSRNSFNSQPAYQHELTSQMPDGQHYANLPNQCLQPQQIQSFNQDEITAEIGLLKSILENSPMDSSDNAPYWPIAALAPWQEDHHSQDYALYPQSRPTTPAFGPLPEQLRFKRKRAQITQQDHQQQHGYHK
jgi:hypothetical protein